MSTPPERAETPPEPLREFAEWVLDNLSPDTVLRAVQMAKAALAAQQRAETPQASPPAPEPPISYRLISGGPNAGRVRRYVSDEESKGEYAKASLPPLETPQASPAPSGWGTAEFLMPALLRGIAQGMREGLATHKSDIALIEEAAQMIAAQAKGAAPENPHDK